MATLGSATITILRAPLVRSARTGEYTRDWDSATSTVVAGCSVQGFLLAEKLAFEVMADREHAKGGLRVFAPAGTDVEETDRVVYSGKTYEVFGFPAKWYGFEGDEHHVEFVIRLREG